MLRRWVRRWLGIDVLERGVAQLRAADLNSLLPDADRLTLAHLEDRVRALEALWPERIDRSEACPRVDEPTKPAEVHLVMATNADEPRYALEAIFSTPQRAEAYVAACRVAPWARESGWGGFVKAARVDPPVPTAEPDPDAD